jgi:Fe2+ or Zn2+ uptake regulation protein
MFNPLRDSHYVISNEFSDSLVLCSHVSEGFLSSRGHVVIIDFGHRMTIDICLIEFLLKLLVLFSDIISFILLSLSVYNKNHHHFYCDCYNVLMSIMLITISL